MPDFCRSSQQMYYIKPLQVGWTWRLYFLTLLIFNVRKGFKNQKAKLIANEIIS